MVFFLFVFFPSAAFCKCPQTQTREHRREAAIGTLYRLREAAELNWEKTDIHMELMGLLHCVGTAWTLRAVPTL